jgi:ParB/RepB/Spo0J family partition protein
VNEFAMTETLIPVEMVVPGDNDREAFDTTGLQELAASIAQYGLAQPITVRPVMQCSVCGALHTERPFPHVCTQCSHDELRDRFQIVAGERRWRSHRLLGRDTIPALVRQMDDAQASGVMLLENIQRAELNPVEEARAYRKRMDQFGWDEERVAQAANVPVGRVRLRLTLLDIVPEAQQLVRSGQLGVKYAYVMRDLDTNRQRIALRYLGGVDTPRLSEFRQLCARLLAEQAQETMFDMAAFMTSVQDARSEEVANRPARVIPVDDDLPAMRKARSVGQALERFIGDLLDRGDDDAARVVGSVYLGLLQHRLTAMPEGRSPLEEYEQS